MLRVDAVEQGGRPGGGGAGGEHAPEQDGGVQAGGLAPLPRRGRRLGPDLRRRGRPCFATMGFVSDKPDNCLGPVPELLGVYNLGRGDKDDEAIQQFIAVPCGCS